MPRKKSVIRNLILLPFRCFKRLCEDMFMTGGYWNRHSEKVGKLWPPDKPEDYPEYYGKKEKKVKIRHVPMTWNLSRGKRMPG